MPAIGTTPPTKTPAHAPPASHSGSLNQDQERAVVLIKGDKAEGTGFLVKSKDGPVVITNQHVLANNPNIKIMTSTGAAVEIVSYRGATDRDLAMIAVKDAGFSYLTLATDVTAVTPGDQVITPGNSEGGEVMLNTTGKVLGIGPDRIEIDNPVYHGNSGGPVFDTKTGKVIGVVTGAVKVDTSDALDKASFASRNSAIQGSMRYFGLRVDNVPQWEDIDWNGFLSETTFLDKFDQRSRCLDSYLNSTSTSSDQQPAPKKKKKKKQQKKPEPAPTEEDAAAANLWLQDPTLVQANQQFQDQAAGNVDIAQKLDAIRELLGSIVDAANADVATIQDTNHFYSYDRKLAKDELAYRQALQKELDGIGSNVDRLGTLPRTDN